MFRFVVTRGSERRTWTVDLKNGSGALFENEAGMADCTLTMSDENLASLVAGKSDAMKLFSSGQLKLAGNMMLAQRLQLLFRSEAPAAAAAPAAPAQAAAGVADKTFAPVGSGRAGQN